MGKKSKRKETVKDHQPFVAKFDDGREVVMPPDCPGWKTNNDALRAFKADGWQDAQFAAGFEASELCEEVRNQLTLKSIEVINVTDMIPEGPDAPHSVLGRVCHDLDRESHSKKKQALIMLRTRKNTPAFVGGIMYTYIAALGGIEEAKKKARDSTCPSLMVFFNGQHMQLPSVCVQGTAKLAGKIVAAMIDRKPDSFTCGICQDPLLKLKKDGEVCIVQFLATDCDHAFHPSCMMDAFRAGAKTCPMCRGPLPMEWVPEGEQSKSRSDDPFKQPKCIGLVHKDDERDRDGYLDALAEQVRNAAIEDGMSGVPDNPPSLS